MRGRKPKPLALHIANGNPSKLDIDKRKEAEPAATPGTPPKPTWLSKEAAANWDYIVGHLETMGTLAQSDATAIAMLSASIATWAEAQRAVQKNGAISEDGDHPSGAFTVASKLVPQISKLVAEFGLTPSSRSRIAIGKTEKQIEDNSILAFIGKKTG